MGELSDFQVGQTVELQQGQTATVQFVGQTHFAAGGWVGVVLDDATGKNDGSVQGQRYFDCQPGHGMFVRPTVPTILEQPTPKANGRLEHKINGDGPKTRQSVAAAKARQESTLDSLAAKRQSINAGSPTPRLRGLGAGRMLKSPTKSPTKHSGAMTSSGNSTPQSAPLSTSQNPQVTNPRAARPPMGPPSTHSLSMRSSRQSITGPVNGAVRPTSTTSASSSLASSNRLSMRPGPKSRLSSIGGESHASASSGHESPAQSLGSEVLSPPIEDVLEETSTNGITASYSQHSLGNDNRDKSREQPDPPRTRSPTSKSQNPPVANNASLREAEDLRTKLRVMEKKRMEDREKLKTFERVQSERDKFEGIIQKLQSKYQPQQQEAADLRRRLKDLDAKIGDLEKQQAENDTVVEVATLDREMAEETAESLRSELDALKQSHEELRLEVEVLREENQELGEEMSPEEKTSQGWLQMERSNERLREALMRLRDVTQEQEADLREQVKELENDLSGLRSAREEQLQLQVALAESESTTAELRQRLEAALGAEDMIEELTEKNLGLNEHLESLKATVEELESLRELNDELEINHTENAKQMQDEIDYSETLLAEQAMKASTQDQTIRDLEYTVTRFRNLVTSMQSDLEEMRTSQQLTEAEANDLNSRSRAMMDLNLRLQASASQAQVKAIDLELGRLEAQESAEHLSIIQLFLPDTFKAERNSVRAYLRFKRIKSKADILHGHVKEKASKPLTAVDDDNVYVCCEVMDKLTFVAQTCSRFERAVRSFDLEAFGRLEGALFDLEPVERAFNGWIEAAKKDELKEASCSAELSRSIALISHLVEVHIKDSLEHHADDVHARGLMMQSQLESTLIALSHTKDVIEAQVSEAESREEEADPDSQEWIRRSGSLVSQMRSARMIMGKAVRQLDDLQSRSLTLDKSALTIIEQSQTSIGDVSESARSFGHSITSLLGEEGQSDTTGARELLSAMASLHTPVSSLSNKLQTVTTNLQAFHNLMSSLNHIVEFSAASYPPPWQLLAEQLANETTTLASYETDISRLNEEIRDKSTMLALRDKTLEELHVKLETLDKRAAESGSRRERVRDLEKVVEAAKERELELINAVNRLRAERNDLRTQRDSLASQAGGTQGSSTATDIPAGSGETTSQLSLSRISSLESEIRTLQAAIRHLRSTSYTHTISSAWDFLGKPLVPQPTPQHQRVKLRQSEAKGVVSELLRLVTDPANGVVRLKERPKGERLGWRPARETCSWQVGRAKEEWEEWREWRDDLGGRRKTLGKHGHKDGKAVVV